MKISREKLEFGDFQTPIELTRKICSLLYTQGLRPSSVLEPTCGTGKFLVSVLERFPSITRGVGVEVDGEYAEVARSNLQTVTKGDVIRILQEDFFLLDWRMVTESLPDPLLVIGNPPWITNSELGGMGGVNLPTKSNFQKYRGIDAKTGKSNFDISEWMLIKALEWIRGREATLAMLCKTAVARKIFLHAVQNCQHVESFDIYRINAPRYFDVSVDACLLVTRTSCCNQELECRVHDILADDSKVTIVGHRDGKLLANVEAYERWRNLEGGGIYKWRSGIKHDCSKVMELRQEEDRFKNGFGELVDLEKEYLYPLLKSSDIANGGRGEPSRWMLVPQRIVGEDTSPIKEQAPKTWAYLEKHASLLNQRASSVYGKQPQFSIFGVGDYSFAPWKVAISGFYKNLDFKVVGPSRGKPAVLDDTCYFIPCQFEEESCLLSQLLNSPVAKEFFSAFIFWDAKRPITVDVLRRLDILALAKELNLDQLLVEYLRENPKSGQLQYSMM